MTMIPSVTVPEGQSGDWSVKRFEISEAAARLESMRMAFKGGRRSCAAGVYTQLLRRGRLIMSDTPDEKRDHYDFVRAAQGRVLINGLGLGMALGACLAKPEVDHVTVVEASPDVIALVAPHYACGRLTVVCADALEWAPPKGARFDAVWHDIWDDICADNLVEMKRLHRRYGRRTEWQGSWARELCEYYAR